MQYTRDWVIASDHAVPGLSTVEETYTMGIAAGAVQARFVFRGFDHLQQDSFEMHCTSGYVSTWIHVVSTIAGYSIFLSTSSWTLLMP